TSLTSSSYPPGARLSARIFPVTITLDSSVRPLSDSNTSGVTWFLGTTPWITPVPSRKMGKISLPLSRLLYSQPRMVTCCPSCRPTSAMVVTGACAVVVVVWSISNQFCCQSLPGLLNQPPPPQPLPAFCRLPPFLPRRLFLL